MISTNKITLVEYYESMRLFANGVNNVKTMPMGIDLFIKKGMKAWSDAWYSTDILKTIVTENIEDIAKRVPDVMISDLTMLLTQMVLGTKKEVQNK